MNWCLNNPKWGLIKKFGKKDVREITTADSCDAAQAYRFDAARDSWMMPPTVTR
jgi:hypothetical protein